MATEKLNRVTIVLEQKEYSGLLKMSVNELRRPQDQVRVILRKELQKQGLMASHVEQGGNEQA